MPENLGQRWTEKATNVRQSRRFCSVKFELLPAQPVKFITYSIRSDVVAVKLTNSLSVWGQLWSVHTAKSNEKHKGQSLKKAPKVRLEVLLDFSQ